MPRAKQVTLSEVVCHFEELEDPRSPINRRHPLVSVVVIALMAVLAGADGPTGIRAWAEAKRELLLRCLDLPHGLPSRDVFRRVLMALEPAAFQQCFVNWLASLRDAAEHGNDERPILAVDGKSLRGSGESRGLGPLHLVSVWLTQAGLTLAQVATEEKSNEITAIPEVLKLVDLSGAIVTIDAMGTQTAIARQIVDGGGDFVLALKGNQGGLYEDVMAYVDAHLGDDFAGVKVRRFVERETSHGRSDVRTYLQFPVPDDLPGRSRWKGLRTIGLAIRESVQDGVETCDVRYYICSLRPGVKQFARAARGHWGIENPCHWTLDVTYREDAHRTRERNLAENLAWLRRFTLSLLKQQPGKKSLAMKRRMCGWNDEYLLQVLAAEES